MRLKRMIVAGAMSVLLMAPGVSIPATAQAPLLPGSSVPGVPPVSIPQQILELFPPHMRPGREPDFNAQLNGLVHSLERKYGAAVGVSVTTTEGTFSAGNPGTGPAWSTIKVPIAVAAIRDGADPALVDRTIKESDNSAGWALWSQVRAREGNPVAAIDRMLAQGRSTATWEATHNNSFVAYGYANWPLNQQSRFGAFLHCVPGSGYVRKDMGEIVGWQRYGLLRRGNFRGKGGWGVDQRNGAYTQRQFGRLETHGGAVGIAVTTIRRDGSGGISNALAVATLDDVANETVRLVEERISRGTLTPVRDCR